MNVPIINGERVVNARAALAMWNNARGQHDAAWVLRHAFELAQALRDMIYAYDRMFALIPGSIEFVACGHASSTVSDACQECSALSERCRVVDGTCYEHHRSAEWERRAHADPYYAQAHPCGHPNHGAADHDCAPFLPLHDAHGSGDLVQGDAKLRENSGDADATDHNEQEQS